jgi:ABC-type transport system involved in multi-copper enzyme maturation permease subunit
MLVLTIARLTIREAARRRLLLALLVLTVIAVLLSAWGFQHLTTIKCENNAPCTVEQVRGVAFALTTLLAFMFSFVLALSAAFTGSSSIATEVESGIAQAILARPVSRTEVVLGKWLGFTALIILFAGVVSIVELGLVQWITGYAAPHLWTFIGFLAAEGVVLMSMALLFSTRLSSITGGVVAVSAFGLAWIGGIVGGFGQAFSNDTVRSVGTISRLLIPTDGLWRGALYSLQPAVYIAAQNTARQSAANPFYAPSYPATPYLTWVLAWIVVIVALAVLSFRQREL